MGDRVRGWATCGRVLHEVGGTAIVVLWYFVLPAYVIMAIAFTSLVYLGETSARIDALERGVTYEAKIPTNCPRVSLLLRLAILQCWGRGP